jgi:hypothetical protein
MMKVYELTNADGRTFAFEIDAPVGGRHAVCWIIRRIPGATLTKTPRLFSKFRDGETFCEFELGTVAFQIEEPFGDNSRYWIGPKDSPCWHPEIEAILRAFNAGRDGT